MYISNKFKKDTGNQLSFREVSLRVFSPLAVFTSVFGMGTGGLLPLCHRLFLFLLFLFFLFETFCALFLLHSQSYIMQTSFLLLYCFILLKVFSLAFFLLIINLSLGKALVLLVSVDFICCHTSISDLSTKSSSWELTDLRHKKTHLVVGFVLICFQHLSSPNTATRRLPLA